MASAKGGRPRGGLPSAEVMEKQNEVVKLRRGGLTWDLIAQRVGYADPSGAQRAFEAANKRVIAEDIAEIRTLETERLDLAQSAIWGKVLQGDNPSIANLLRIMERRAKLLGLDQPTRIQAEVISYDGNSVRAELERILAQSSHSGSQGALAEGSGESEPTTA